jgi:hypothetical protein
MASTLTDEQKKARRAEINRENSKKSTGPKTPAGKMKVRLNGLKHGARSSIIDLSQIESLVLLPCEGPQDYQRVVANMADKLQPRDEVELGICQRIADLQWRLLRLTRNERIFNEECLLQSSQMAHPGVSEKRLGELDCMNGFRVGVEAKMCKEFRREETAIHRAINSSLRELDLFRKLDPLPKTPLTRSAQIIGPSQSPTALEPPPAPKKEVIQPDDLIEETTPASNNQSQVLTGWVAPKNVSPWPLRMLKQPQTMTAGGGRHG